jgi:hypothetical protein
MNDENTRTSLGKWSVAFALIPLIVVFILLLLLIIPARLRHISGEAGLGLLLALGIVIFFGSCIVVIASLTGIGLAIAAIYKTSQRQGRIGLLLNIIMLIVTVAFWLLIRFHS